MERREEKTKRTQNTPGTRNDSWVASSAVLLTFLFVSLYHYTAPHCNKLQHTAPHCNKLQHTATHAISPTRPDMNIHHSILSGTDLSGINSELSGTPPHIWVVFSWKIQTQEPPALMHYVKHLRAGPAEMPFRNWYTAKTNHFHLTDSVRWKWKNPTRLSNKTSNAWSCAEDQILENKNLRIMILNICTER